MVDRPFSHTSRALAKKLRKEYTNQHRSNLVILTLGTKQSIIAMLESLSEKLKKEQIEKLNYSNVYIISLDFLNEQALLARISSTEPFESESFPCKNDELGFIKLTAIEFSTIEDDRKYLMVCDGIFDDTHRCRYDEGRALKSWVKEIRPCSGFRVKSRPGFFTNIQDTSQSCVIASANLCFLELMIVGCIWSVCISNLVFVFIFLVAKLTKLNIKSTDREGATLSQRYPFFVWSNFLLILILAICCWLYFIDYADAGSWLLLLTKDNSMLSIIVGISGIGISFGILAAFLVRNSRKKKDSIEEGKVEAKQ